MWFPSRRIWIVHAHRTSIMWVPFTQDAEHLAKCARQPVDAVWNWSWFHVNQAHIASTCGDAVSTRGVFGFRLQCYIYDYRCTAVWIPNIAFVFECKIHWYSVCVCDLLNLSIFGLCFGLLVHRSFFNAQNHVGSVYIHRVFQFILISSTFVTLLYIMFSTVRMLCLVLCWTKWVSSIFHSVCGWNAVEWPVVAMFASKRIGNQKASCVSDCSLFLDSEKVQCLVLKQKRSLSDRIEIFNTTKTKNLLNSMGGRIKTFIVGQIKHSAAKWWGFSRL